MPCRDNYPDPSIEQRRANEIAQHAEYFAEQVDLEPPQYVRVAAEQPFTNTSPDRLANYLCKLIRANEDVLRSLPEDEDCLKLKLWWIIHKEQDRIKERADAEQLRKQLLFETAIDKLTDEEIAVVRELI